MKESVTIQYPDKFKLKLRLIIFLFLILSVIFVFLKSQFCIITFSVFVVMTIKYLNICMFSEIQIFKDNIEIDSIPYSIKDISTYTVPSFRGGPTYVFFKYKQIIISKFYLSGVLGYPTMVDYCKLKKLIFDLKNCSNKIDWDIYKNKEDVDFENIGIIFYIIITVFPLLALFFFVL